MTKKEFLDRVRDKKVQDYTLTIIFFLLFAFFVFFAIRPNLLTAFNLRRELAELRLKDKQFEDTILKIVEYQATLANNRDNFYLLDEALPQQPQIYKVVDDIRKTASESSMVATRINVEEVDVQNVKKNNRIKSYAVSLDTAGSSQDLKNFINNLYQQRRLKYIRDLDIARNVDNPEGKYIVRFTLEGLYL